MTGRRNAPANTIPSDALSGNHIDPLNFDRSDNDRAQAASITSAKSLDDIRDELNSHIAHDVSDPAFRRYCNDSKFMDEDVLVCIAPSHNPLDTHIVPVGVNGSMRYIPRGHWVKVKRCFLEVLARANPFSVSTPEGTNGAGERETRIVRNRGNGFHINVRDLNPVGEGWLQGVMAEA